MARGEKRRWLEYWRKEEDYYSEMPLEGISLLSKTYEEEEGWSLYFLAQAKLAFRVEVGGSVYGGSIVPMLVLNCYRKEKKMSHIKTRWKCGVRHLLGVSKNQKMEAPEG